MCLDWCIQCIHISMHSPHCSTKLDTTDMRVSDTTVQWYHLTEHYVVQRVYRWFYLNLVLP